MEQTLTIKLLNKIKKATDNKAVRVELQALYSGKLSGNKYLWTCKGATKVTEEDTVLLLLPNWYCGSEVEVTVELQKDAWPFLSRPFFPPIYDKSAQDEDHKQLLLTQNLVGSIKFVPQSEIKITKMEWGDYNYELKDKNTPLEVNTLAIAMFEMIGLNGQRLTFKAHTGKHEISLSKTVMENACYFPFMVSKDFLGDAHKDKLKVELYHDRNLLHSEKADLVEDTYKPVKLITSFPLQPVMVGNLDIVENNFLPCKYTKITAKYDVGSGSHKKKVEFVVFNELKSTEIKPINVVGKKKLNIELADYDTKKCKVAEGKGSHIENNAIIFRPDKNFPVKIEKNGKFDFEVEFDYGFKSNYYSNLKLLKYIWPTANDLQTYTLSVDTCRHSKKIPINVYPDIEWELSLEVGSAAASSMSYTNVKGKQLEQKKEEAKKIDENEEVTFKLSLTGKTEERTTKLAAEYEAKILKILKALVHVKTTLDKITGVKKITESQVKSVANLISFQRPFSFTIDYPVISITGNWNFENSPKADNKVVRQGSIRLGFNPLIKAQGNIDILKFLEYYPPAKLLLKAADLFFKAMNGEIWFRIYGIGQIDLNGTIHFNKEEIADMSGAATLTIGLELGVKIGKSDLKKVNFQADKKFEAELSAKGETSLSLTVKRGLSTEGIYINVVVGFGGIVAFVTASLKVSKFKMGVENEPFKIIDPVPDMGNWKYYILGGS